MKHFKQFLTILCLLVAGWVSTALSAELEYVVIDNVAYRWGILPDHGLVAFVVGIKGSSKTVTIPETISTQDSAGLTYSSVPVVAFGYYIYHDGTDFKAVQADISNSYVKSLVFKGDPSLSGALGVFAWGAPVSCPKLTDIYVMDGKNMTLSDYFFPTASSITVHELGLTDAEIASLKTNTNYDGFKDIVPIECKTTTLNGIEYTYGDLPGKGMGAYVTNIAGTAEEVTIPESISISGVTGDVPVLAIGYSYWILGTEMAPMSSTISNSSLKRLYIQGTPSLSESYDGQVVTNGAINCSNLKDIYLEDPESFFFWFTPLTFANHDDITLHLKDMTEQDVANWKASLGSNLKMKDLVPYYTSFDCTLKSGGYGVARVIDLGNYASFGTNGAQDVIPFIIRSTAGSTTKTIQLGHNYATAFTCSSVNKTVHLKRNNQDVTPSQVTRSGEVYYYYDEKNVQDAVTFEWYTADKECSVQIRQKLTTGEERTGTVNYSYQHNGYVTGSFTTASKTLTCAQGSTLTLTIPRDVQNLGSVKRDVTTNCSYSLSNNRYTVEIPVPATTSSIVDIIWQPVPEVNNAPPKIMIVRSGEGQIVFKGLNYLFSQHEGENVWEERVVTDCVDPVTIVSVPDEDYGGEPLAEGCWGLRAEVTPAIGQVIKTFLIGQIGKDGDTNRDIMSWEDFNYQSSSYTSYDETTGTYIFDMRGEGDFVDYMEFGNSSDFTILIAMGPPEELIKTHATLNFVRKGGKSSVRFYREDCETVGWFDIDEGTTTHELKLTTPAEADVCDQNITQDLVITPQAGETIHVYCDGEDISTEFELTSNNERIYVLERADHTYSILIEEPEIKNIDFADSAVKAICVENWDTNGDGELSYEEAAAVTTLNKKKADGTYGESVFKGNTVITSFDEFQYFTGLTVIGKDAFRGDTELTSIVLPQSVERIYGGWAFFGCSSLEHIVLPDNLKSIDSVTFGQTNIRSITIPENADFTLGNGVFSRCPLVTLYIPSNVSKIYDYIFEHCSSLVSIAVDEANSKYDSREGCNAIIETETNTLIASCKNTVIPQSVTALGTYAFFKTDGLTRLELPAGITSIGKYGIKDCSSLTTIVAHMPEPFEINTSASSNDYNISGLPATCKLIVPYGKRQAYIDAGWTESIFKGGVVEDKSQFDVNRDSSVSIADVTTLVNIILGKPIQ